MGIQTDQCILVIENGPEDLSLLVDGLKATGAKNPIKHLGSGEEALDYLFHRGVWSPPTEVHKPTLILLDLRLSSMDGPSFLSVLKQHPSLRMIPVIVFTADANNEEVTHCYDLGANSCMKKPQDLENYIHVLSRLMEYWGEVIVIPQAEMSMTTT